MSDYKKDVRDMTAHAFVGGLVGGLLGMLAGPGGSYVGAALGAYALGKPRARELNRRAQQDDEGT